MARSRRGGSRFGGGGGGGGGAKVTPNLAWDREGTRMLNLSVLRRLDPGVADILITAAHVVAYGLDEDRLEWTRKPVEGSLFVVKRNTQPRFQLIIMNRVNTENLVEDLLTSFEVEVQVPYLMYRNAADKIIGIWFYDSQECQEVAHLFRRIEYAYSRASPKSSLSSKSVFEEPEAASGPYALPVVEDTLERPKLPTTAEDDDDDDIEEFFLTRPKLPTTAEDDDDDDVEEFFLTPSKAATCVHTIGGTGAVQPNQSFRAIPSPTHGSHNSTAPHSSSQHSRHPSRTSSATLRAFDPHRPNSSTTIQPASLLDSKSPLLAPMASTQSTVANAASSLPTVPPLHPPFADRQPKSAPLLHPFSLPPVPPVPPYGMPLLQPFPPPNPLPLFTPSASYSQVVTREQVGAALLRLAQNDNFIDMVYREMAKRP